MSSKQAEVDVIRRIIDVNGDAGACIEVGPWPDSPSDCLELRTASDESKKYYGPISLTMNLDFAEALGKALIAAAAEMRLAL